MLRKMVRTTNEVEQWINVGCNGSGIANTFCKWVRFSKVSLRIIGNRNYWISIFNCTFGPLILVESQ